MDGRRRKWSNTVDLLGLAEKAEDLAAPVGGALCAQSSQSLTVQSLPDRLEGRPLLAPWRGEGEADSRKLFFAAQIGDRIDGDLKAPQVSG